MITLYKYQNGVRNIIEGTGGLQISPATGMSFEEVDISQATDDELASLKANPHQDELIATISQRSI